MAIITKRPWSSASNANFTRTGAASDVAAVTDDLDSSYLSASTTTASSILFYMSSGFSLAAGEYIKQVRIRIRVNTTTPAGASTYAYWTTQIKNSANLAQTIPLWPWGYSEAIATYASGWRTTNWSGQPWSVADVNNIALDIRNSVINKVPRIYELYLDVETNTNPVAAVTAPASGSTITNTSRPSVEFTYTDADNDPMGAYQVKIFSAAQYGAAGFDPATSPATWDSGIRGAPAPYPVVPTKSLPNNTTYRAYVKVAQEFAAYISFASIGVSTWVYSQFSIALDTPLAPELFVSVSNELNQEGQNSERSIYGWQAYDGSTLVGRSTAQFRSSPASLELTALGTSTFTAASAPSGIWYPEPRRRYSVSAYFRSAVTSRAARVQVEWYDKNNVQLGVETGPNVTTTTTGWTQATLTATAPAGARYGLVALVVVRLAGGNIPAFESHYVDDIVSVPLDGNQRTSITVELNENMLSENAASIETDASEWASISGGSLARTTAQFANGSASLQLTCAATSDFYIQNPITPPATPGNGYLVVPHQVYTALASFKAGSTARSCGIQINWYNSSGANVGANLGTLAADTTSGWTQVSVTAVAPAGAVRAFVYPLVKNPAANEIHYLDKIKLAPGTGTTWSRGGIIGTHTITVERSVDNGATWTSRGIYLQYFSNDQQIYFYYDYEAPPATDVIYRASTTVLDDGVDYVTGPYSANSVAVQITTGDWWLKSTTDASKNMILDVIGESFNQNKPEDKATFSALGRTRKLTVADVIKGEEGVLELDFPFETDYQRFEALRNLQEPLLLVRGWTNEQWYISLGESREMRLYRYTPTYRQVTVPWVEVDVPT